MQEVLVGTCGLGPCVRFDHHLIVRYEVASVNEKALLRESALEKLRNKN